VNVGRSFSLVPASKTNSASADAQLSIRVVISSQWQTVNDLQMIPWSEATAAEKADRLYRIQYRNQRYILRPLASAEVRTTRLSLSLSLSHWLSPTHYSLFLVIFDSEITINSIITIKPHQLLLPLRPPLPRPLPPRPLFLPYQERAPSPSASLAAIVSLARSAFNPYAPYSVSTALPPPRPPPMTRFPPRHL